MADRAVGQVFFGAGLMMDSEVIWEGAQRAIKEAACPQYPAMLPSHSPMLTHEWPWITQPGEGPSGLSDLGKL